MKGCFKGELPKLVLR